MGTNNRPLVLPSLTVQSDREKQAHVKNFVEQTKLDKMMSLLNSQEQIYLQLYRKEKHMAEINYKTKFPSPERHQHDQQCSGTTGTYGSGGKQQLTVTTRRMSRCNSMPDNKLLESEWKRLANAYKGAPLALQSIDTQQHASGAEAQPRDLTRPHMRRTSISVQDVLVGSTPQSLASAKTSLCTRGHQNNGAPLPRLKTDGNNNETMTLTAVTEVKFAQSSDESVEDDDDDGTCCKRTPEGVRKGQSLLSRRPRPSSAGLESCHHLSSEASASAEAALRSRSAHALSRLQVFGGEITAAEIAGRKKMAASVGDKLGAARRKGCVDEVTDKDKKKRLVGGGGRAGVGRTEGSMEGKWVCKEKQGDISGGGQKVTIEVQVGDNKYSSPDEDEIKAGGGAPRRKLSLKRRRESVHAASAQALKQELKDMAAERAYQQQHRFDFGRAIEKERRGFNDVVKKVGNFFERMHDAGLIRRHRSNREESDVEDADSD